MAENKELQLAIQNSLFKGSYEDRIEKMLDYRRDSYTDEEYEILKEVLISKSFVPSSPILRNFNKKNKDGTLPISCFVNEVADELPNIINIITQTMDICSVGGGLGTDWSNVREAGAKIRDEDVSSGIMPFLNLQSSATVAISQGSARQGSACAYLKVNHPEIINFIKMRKQGGDSNLKAFNLHHGVILDDKFMEAVVNDEDYELITRGVDKNKKYPLVKARHIWNLILETRIETGEPFLIFIDNANNNLCEDYKKHNLKVNTSNLCTEIFSHTTKDKYAICCLGSFNLEGKFTHNKKMVGAVYKFMCNVWDYFYDEVNNIENTLKIKDRVDFKKHRDIGIGFMGYNDLVNYRCTEICYMTYEVDVIKCIEDICEELNRLSGGMNVTSIAPTSTISGFAGCSPSLEPRISNLYMHKSKLGSFTVVRPDIIEIKDYNEEELLRNKGSVANSNLSDVNKKNFRTAYEYDQQELISRTAKIQKFITQGISHNLFYKSGEDRKKIHQDHIFAWKSGLKSLYYLKTTNASCTLEDKTCQSCQ